MLNKKEIKLLKLLKKARLELINDLDREPLKEEVLTYIQNDVDKSIESTHIWRLYLYIWNNN